MNQAKLKLELKVKAEQLAFLCLQEDDEENANFFFGIALQCRDLTFETALGNVSTWTKESLAKIKGK